MRRFGLLVCSSAIVLGGCTSVGEILPDTKVDYRSSTTRAESKLEVPPDLVSPRSDDRFGLPSGVSGATLSSYARQRAAREQQGGAATRADVLPELSGMRIERFGALRWLTVDRPAAQLWPLVRGFWLESGFTLAIDQPELGLMETDWAENRAKIPLDFVRSSIGKVFDSLYTTGERDRFRVRLEAVAGGTEIHLTHRGMTEVFDQGKTSTVWTQRPNDPELEAEFLRRLMMRFGADAGQAGSRLTAPAQPIVLRVRALPDGRLQVDDSFERAWRRVGLALDRAGFTVEDRDRSRGTYFVRYIDPATDARSATPGIFDRLFGSNPDPAPRRFRIVLSGAGGAASTANIPSVTDIQLFNKDGLQVSEPSEKQIAARIANLLLEQLK